MLQEFCCGSIVFSENGGKLYVLLTQNLKGRHWSFPKGHVENNETKLETAKREVFEETGIHVEPLAGYTASVSYSTGKDSTKTVWYFVSVVPYDTELLPQPEEVSAIKWVEAEAAAASITYKRDADVLAEAVDFYTNRYNKEPKC